MPEHDINPYAAPAAPSKVESARREIVHSIRAPSIGLLILSLVWSSFAAIMVIAMVVLTIGYFAESGTLKYFGPRLDELIQFLLFFPSFFTAYGAWCMRRTVRYRTALAASIVACIPFLTPWFVLGIPFGIWALVVLRRKDVRAAFATQQGTRY